MSAAGEPQGGLSYFGIVRLGLVQAGLGAIVVLTTSTMNRVMVVEYALPAMLPGALVAYHYAIQVLRPRFGHGADVSRRRTPWIVGGMATLAAGGVLAAVATAWMGEHVVAGIGLAILAFSLIGAGVAAAGTALLALLAASVVPVRRGAAATIVWLMMIAGFAVTAGVAGEFLDPFSPQRLVAVTSVVSAIALTITLIALVGLERPRPELEAARADDAPKPPFRVALREVWQDDEARRFTIFVFMSMLAYNLQDLILEPFGGTVFAMTPGETTRLAGVQHGGVLAGMLLVAFAVTWVGRGRLGSLKAWTVGGCVASAVAFVGLITVAMAGPGWPLSPFVLFLGVANGTFAVAAIGTMMTLAGGGRLSGGGIRLGVWGAAQAFAFGIGGFVGTVAIDATRALFADPATAYALVFALEGATFLVAARIAAGVGGQRPSSAPAPLAAKPIAG